MRYKELIAILLVTVNISLWKNGCAQSYYDLYSNNEVYRTENNEIIAAHSSIPFQTETSHSAAAIKGNYASIVGHQASTTTAKVPTVTAIVVVVAAVVVFIVLWLLYLFRGRKHSMLQKEFTMTNQDTHLSSTALTNDPYRSVSRRNSCDSFSIPMPDESSQARSSLTPKLSVTSPSGKTTLLEVP